MGTIGDRVRRERDAQGISRTELARRTGIGYSTISELERGGMQTSTRLHVIAAALGVSVRWLETGKGSRTDPAEENTWVDIQGYAQAVGLGKGAEAQEYAETHKLKFRADSLARKHLRPDGLAVMYGQGDSMLPRIRQGDAILFDTNDIRPLDGALFVVQWKAEIYVKRAMVLDETVFFASDNPAGDHHWIKPKRMDAKRDPIHILGRVRWIGSWEG